MDPLPVPELTRAGSSMTSENPEMLIVVSQLSSLPAWDWIFFRSAKAMATCLLVFKLPKLCCGMSSYLLFLSSCVKTILLL